LSFDFIFDSFPSQAELALDLREPLIVPSRGSATLPWAGSAIRAGETQESQNRQYRDKQKRHHESLPSSPI
jgi:hypothetical protein